MLKKCVDCKHCVGRNVHYNVPKPFDWLLEFHCLKYHKYLGCMVKDENEVEDLPCFEERQRKEEKLLTYYDDMIVDKFIGNDDDFDLHKIQVRWDK